MEWYGKWKAMNEMPEGQAKTEAREKLKQYNPIFRLYAGRGRSGSSLVELADAQGKTRLRLEVDSSGEARIEFLDASGKVTRRIPE
jgi:hypothetical protein